MITGEHAVVYGHRAIVAAIDQRVTITLTQRSDRGLRISSQIAKDYFGNLDDIAPSHEYRFVLAAIATHLPNIANGFELSITSEIDPTLGLGSSAAVTVATLGVLCALTGSEITGVHADAVEIVRFIQQRGSGADLAASVHGGMIAYGAPPDADIQKLPAPPDLGLRYAGYKTPTAEVLRGVAERMAKDEEKFHSLYCEMGVEAEKAIHSASQKDWTSFGLSLNRYQKLMDRLGVNDESLQGMIDEARKDSAVLAAKISGSGLGDCVLAVGGVPRGFVPANLATQGLIVHV